MHEGIAYQGAHLRCSLNFNENFTRSSCSLTARATSKESRASRCFPCRRGIAPTVARPTSNKEMREGIISFMCYFATFPNNNILNARNFITSSPQLTLTTEMTIIEEKLTSQVAMETEVAE